MPYSLPVRALIASLFCLLCSACGGGAGGVGGGDGGGPGVLAPAKSFIHTVGGTELDIAFDVATHTDGTTYSTGAISATATFNSGDASAQTVEAEFGIDGYLARHAPDGSLMWIELISATSTAVGTSVAVLADGSCLVVGSVEGYATFAADTPQEVTVPAANGAAFVARYGPEGDLHWVRVATGGRSQALQVAVASNGYVVVTGEHKGSATFGTGAVTETLVSKGEDDGFVARYASDGTLVWAQSQGSTFVDRTTSVDIDANGDIFVGGLFHNSMVLGENEPGEVTLVSSGSFDGFVAKYTSFGTLVWARRFGSQSTDSLNTLRAHPDGGVVFGGWFSGAVLFGLGGGPKLANVIAVGSTDAYVARYQSDGSLLWARSVGGALGDRTTGVDIAPDGSIAVSGWISSVSTFGLGEPSEVTLTTQSQADGFLAFYLPDGAFQGVRHVAGIVTAVIRSVAHHSNGDWAICGSIQGFTEYDPTSGSPPQFDTAGGHDGFVGRVQSDGSY